MRRNKILSILLFLVINLPLSAQNGQEWINFDQQYFKIPIAEESAYELDFASLQSVGIPLASIDARSFQIFHRGREIAIRVVGQTDGRLDPGDAIQFLGRGNDGRNEVELYKQASDQPHQYYSLFSDTTAYFLTWTLDGTQGLRMNEVNPIANTTALPTEAYVYKTNLQLYTNNGITGRSYSPQNSVRSTAFDLGEGWTGSRFQSSTDFVISEINQQERSSDPPFLEMLVQGRNNRPHVAEVQVGPDAANLRTLTTLNFSNFGFSELSTQISWSDVNTNGSMLVRVVPQGQSPDRMSVSYLRLRYGRSTDLTDQNSFQAALETRIANRSFLSLQNVNSNAALYEVTDFDRPVLLGSARSGNTISTVIENTSTERSIYIQNQNFRVPELQEVYFKNFASLNPNYIIISHPDLRQPSSDYEDGIAAYSTYRASVEGGGYDTLTLDMPMIENQFNYGEKGPLGIYRLTEFLQQNKNVEFIFIIGKGLNWFHNYYRRTSISSNLFREYVPTAGSPGSDNFYAFGLDGSPTTAISFGRLNANNVEDVANYLNKIREMEALPLTDLRRKHFLHLSGGLSTFEVNRFKNFIEEFSSFVVQPFIGGDFTNFTKETTQVIEFINVSEEVNRGVNLITFFGHSSTNTTDIDIGFVTDESFGYANKGRYPIILINGCNAGSVFEIDRNAVTFGENWMNAADKGAIGILAHSDLGFPNELKRFTDIFYEKTYLDSALIDQPLGLVHKEIIRDYLNSRGGLTAAEIHLAQALQVNLLADPAYKVFPASTPDYSLDESEVAISDPNATTLSSSTENFAIQLAITNFGISSLDSIELQINRFSSFEALLSSSVISIPPVLYKDTIEITLENQNLGEFGNNRFEIEINPNQLIQENNLSNNLINVEVLLSSGTSLNLFPYNNAIVSQDTVRLSTQSSNLLEDNRDFIFQLDTSANFSSPLFREQIVNARVFAQWAVALNSPDETVWYWRTKFANPNPEESDEWVQSSFLYQETPETAWVQGSAAQFNENEIQGLSVSNNGWNFTQEIVNIEVSAPASIAGSDRLSILIEGEEFSTFGSFVDECAANSLNLIAFDRSSGNPFRILSNGDFDVLDPLSCGRSPQVINQIFNSQLSNPSQFFQNYYDQLPSGDFVLLSSYDSVAWSTLLANNRAELLDLGASATIIDNLQNGEPYILLGRKGAGQGNGTEVIANNADAIPNNEETISLQANFSTVLESGLIISKVIGPVRSWGTLSADISSQEVDDELVIDIFGLDSVSNQTLLFSNASLPIDLSTVNAQTYPFLRIRASISDPTNLSPLVIDSWKVTVDELPDALVIPADDFANETQILEEGEIYDLNLFLINPTRYEFDQNSTYSLSLLNTSLSSSEVAEDTIASAAPFSRVDFTIPIDTRSRGGLNNVIVALNRGPRVTEKFTFNNTLNLGGLLDVKTDSLPPSIDVTFDGVKILDGDIVSPNPFINIVLKDDNSFINKQDTSGVQLELLPKCEGCALQRIYFSNPEVSWLPATDERDFTVEFRPDRLQDGIYELRVNGRDASNNQAGAEPYSVEFEVVNESSITNFYPYPNPFSTSTRFVFTLTGEEVPDEIKIQILTVSGRVVREILQDEIGPIKIGNNITDFAWDGRDQFGDLLANGVYLYRVLVRVNGEYVQQRETSADKAFKNGYGKLYILR